MTYILARYRRSFEGLPRTAWILALVMLVNRSGSMVLAFLSIYLSYDLGWGDRFAGNAVAVYGLGACFGAFIGGRLSAKLGAYLVQQSSLIATAVGYCFLSLMTTKFSVLSALFLVSVAAESLRPANVTAIAEAVPAHLHRRAFALNRLAVNLGFTFGPAIGGVLATKSYSLLFFADAASCVAAALLLATTRRVTQTQASFAVAVAAENEPTEHAAVANAIQFACFAGVSLLLMVIFFQVISTYPIFLRNQYGLSEWQIGFLFSINTLMIVAFEMVLVESMNGLRDLRIIAIGSLLICEGFALLSFGNGYGFAILVVLVWTIGEMVAMPTMMAYVSRSSTKSGRARRIGLYSTTVAIGFVIAPLFGAWCYDIHPRLIWWVAAAMGPIVCWSYLAIDASDHVNHSNVVNIERDSSISIRDAREHSIRDLGIERVEPFV